MHGPTVSFVPITSPIDWKLSRSNPAMSPHQETVPFPAGPPASKWHPPRASPHCRRGWERGGSMDDVEWSMVRLLMSQIPMRIEPCAAIYPSSIPGFPRLSPLSFLFCTPSFGLSDGIIGRFSFPSLSLHLPFVTAGQLNCLVSSTFIFIHG